MPDGVPAPSDVAATHCATMIDEWHRGGVGRVVIAPGSRSTPLALAALAHGELAVSVHHDERSAAFVALGVGLATGRPALVVTTSGTAAVELHPAVVEAHQARVPMLVATADRPPELHDIGAPQTVDQQHLFGCAVRWFADPGVATWDTRHGWRSFAAQALQRAMGAPPGPVQVNLPFREPLVGSPHALPEGRADGGPWHGTPRTCDAAGIVTVSRSARGLVVAGRGAARHREAVDSLGWPVLADPRAGVAGVAHADPILRVGSFARRHLPDLVVRIGEPPASRVVNEWIDASPARQVVVADAWLDPGRQAASLGSGLHVHDDGAPPRGWRAAWRRADRAAAGAIAQRLGAERALTEPGVARVVAESVPDGTHLVAASSMPVRDLEWFAPRRARVTVHANRGANGIDGVVSTAVGVALTGRRTVALVGDLAFLHDTTALIALARRRLDLTVVVVDNDGGGIFSFLPQARQLPRDQFERLLGTPHGSDTVAIARSFGLPSRVVRTPGALGRALRGRPGTRVLVVPSDREANATLHADLFDAVACALGGS